jgi:hypothetical protein
MWINCEKFITLVWVVTAGEGISAQFCYKPKTALENCLKGKKGQLDMSTTSITQL